MSKKKKSNPNINAPPDIENLIRIIAKTLKETLDSDSISSDFGLDIKAIEGAKKADKDTKHAQSAGQPLPEQPYDPFIETIYKPGAVITVGNMCNAPKDKISVTAFDNGISIEVKWKNGVYSKRVNFEKFVDPSKAEATYKNGVLEITLPVVQLAVAKEAKLSIS
ncbi:Hsp20/alpha crystallin family protein [Candidatus Marsarchaeota archaeon]|nr:Hsp20/alpha crystallin family protein [Candidatus Marsarchaeota archaeon]MCL5404527.1 Hsp20/alpha crystallin family protein [Candidatus Marsarchaeota archaeon]